MYSAFSCQLAQDHAAGLHRQARQDALARAARQNRQADKPQSGHRLPRLPAIALYRVRVAFGTRS